MSYLELFQRYTYAAGLTRDPAAIAACFTEDGILEAPLVPPGHRLPRRLEGRDAIRAGVSAFHTEPAFEGTPNIAETRFALHDTAEPGVFIAEIDAVTDLADGSKVTVSLVQIFRARDGLIAHLRDYFAVPA